MNASERQKKMEEYYVLVVSDTGMPNYCGSRLWPRHQAQIVCGQWWPANKEEEPELYPGYHPLNEWIVNPEKCAAEKVALAVSSGLRDVMVDGLRIPSMVPLAWRYRSAANAGLHYRLLREIENVVKPLLKSGESIRIWVRNGLVYDNVVTIQV